MKQPPPPFDPPLIVPAELYNRRNWIGWRLVPKPGQIKPAKVPICIPTGSSIDFLNPKNHVSYDEAVEAIPRLKLSGVGFAITGDCGIIGGDMDKCRNPDTGEIEPWAFEAIKCGETWFEVSPSGCGIRFFALAEDILPRAVVSNDAGVEIYPSGRYLTFTGDHIQGSPYEVRTATRTIMTLLEHIDAVKAEKAVSEVPRPSGGPSAAPPSAKVERLQHDDAYAKTPFGMINTRAMANLKLWVPELFPTAEFQPGTKGYRIKSADLGRPELVEDLSIHPLEGITDWGVHDMGDPKQGRRSAIDLVIEWEPGCRGDRRKAAIWLGKRLGVSLDDEPRFTRIDDAPPASNDSARSDLTLAAWLERVIPPRQFLLGSVLCTTSRWLLFGETGVGKSMLAYDIAGAVAAGMKLLNWAGSGRPARVMIIDGEMPIETFKERMELIASRYGAEIQLYGYNRDALGDGQMPPLNDEAGQRWLMAEIEAVKPDLIIFDSIMCLLSGVMSEEESWAPVKLLVKQLTSRRIAQIWLHHTGHDGSKGFGTKTREWEMDTVVRLAFTDDERDKVAMEFRKARLRTPANTVEFEAAAIELGESGWTAMELVRASAGRQDTDQWRLTRAIERAYDALQSEVEDTAGPDGYTVRKVKIGKLRDKVKSMGFLEVGDKREIVPSARKAFQRTREIMVQNGQWKEDDGLFWRDRPSTFPGVEQEVY